MVNDFENYLIGELRQLLEDEDQKGVVMAQSQEQSMRGGKFQMAQYADILVDSPDDEFYLAFEAKNAKADSNTPKFYFSAKYSQDQIEKQVNYALNSGRTFIVAVRILNFQGDENYNLLFPLQYFFDILQRGDKGIEWSKLVSDGIDFTDKLTMYEIDMCKEQDNLKVV